MMDFDRGPPALSPPMPEYTQTLEAAIAALQAQRAALGDAVVDAALAPLIAQRTAQRRGAQQLRLVSVLFLDSVSSTALTQGLDAEDVHEVIDGALARFAAVVQAHGDSLLAAFGHVSASEDDAERAVRAGLALTVLRLASARRSPPCPVRTGSADSRDRTRRRERRHDRAVTSFAAHLPAGARGARRCRRAGRGRVAGARPRGADVAGPPHRRCDVARTLPCTARHSRAVMQAWCGAKGVP